MPAPIIHAITTRESSAIYHATKTTEMENASINMLKEFCEIIQSIKNSKYSALVQSVLYSISKNYADGISVNTIARELGVSESYMIARFKQETKTTPAACMKRVRLKNAANLLISTNDEIQKISGSVGIPDANYFVKIFKAEFGMTPGAYRKLYKI